jgi:hypothetical protein
MIGAGPVNAVSGTDTLVQLLIVLAGSGVMVATIQGLFTRRKTHAEVESTGASATKILTDAAAVIVANMQSDNINLRTEINSLRAELTAMRHWRDQMDDVLDVHEVWDKRVYEAIGRCTTDHGYPDPGPPPPLRVPE